MKLKHILFGVVAGLSALTLQAANPGGYTDGELELAAPYCPDIAGKYGNMSDHPSPRAGYWVGLMGPGFWHMHHYCWAMVNLRRAALLPANKRDFAYGTVLGDLAYVLENTSPDFIMLPEIFTQIGEVELLRNAVTAASVAFERARRLKPSYVPAYTSWIEALIKNKQRDKAMALVREGLSQAPQSKTLLDQYRRLGGEMAKLPTPVIEVVAPTPNAPTSAPAQPASANQQ